MRITFYTVHVHNNKQFDIQVRQDWFDVTQRMHKQECIKKSIHSSCMLVLRLMNNTVGYSLGGAALTRHCTAHLQPQAHVYDHCTCVNDT